MTKAKAKVSDRSGKGPVVMGGVTVPGSFGRRCDEAGNPQKLVRLFAAVFFAVMMAGCGPGRAYIDRSGEGGIVWPGPPETPRIRYLWAVKAVNLKNIGMGAPRIEDLIFGRVEGDMTDPRSSNTLMHPYGLYVDEKRLYVADPGAARVTVIDLKDGGSMQLVELDGEAELEYPTGVAANRGGRIFVADPNKAVVGIYDPDGRFRGYLAGPFLRPAGLAYDRNLDRLYVVDSHAHRVFGYDGNGRRIMEIGQRGEESGRFNFPSHAFVDDAGILYVTDALNFRVQAFSVEGTFLFRLGTYGDAYSDLDKPKGLAVDSEGHIYVADGARDMIKIFDKRGRLLLFFGKAGRDLGDFSMPTDVFIDKNDVVYVADMLNMRVQAFQYIQGGESP